MSSLRKRTEDVPNGTNKTGTGIKMAVKYKNIGILGSVIFWH